MFEPQNFLNFLEALIKSKNTWIFLENQDKRKSPNFGQTKETKQKIGQNYQKTDGSTLEEEKAVL